MKEPEANKPKVQEYAAHYLGQEADMTLTCATAIVRRMGTLSLVSIVVLILANFCFSQPKVTLGPTVGPPTTRVLVSGSGFSADASIDIFFDATYEALVLANGSGSFSIGVEVPSSALPGDHWVSAVQLSADTVAKTVFLVRTNWREFGFTPENTRNNPYENVLNPSTVGSIHQHWNVAEVGDLAPAVANGVVYFVGPADYNLYAVNAITGAYLSGWGTVYGVSSSPAVFNGVVYVGCDDHNVHALNAITGAKLWSFTTGDIVYSSPAVANGVVYFGSDDNNVYALNATTGAKLWSFTTGSAVMSPPAVANGVVYVASEDSNVYALNASTGAKLWSFTTGGYMVSAPAVANGVVYVASEDSNLYALNARTGAKLWSYTTNSFLSSPALANGVVYANSFYDNLYALNASTGAELWSFNSGSGVQSSSSPAVANGVVYVGSADNNVYALNASTGATLWSFNPGAGVYVSPVVANGVLYVESGSKLYAFDHAWILKNSSPITYYSSSSDHPCAPMNVTAGDLLLSYNIVFSGSTSGLALTNSDSQGNTWAVSQTETIPNVSILQIQYTRAKTSGSDTIEVRAPSNVNIIGNGCEEWNGSATSGAVLDASGAANSSLNGTVASASAIPTGASDLVVGFCTFPRYDGANFAMSAGPGYTQDLFNNYLEVTSIYSTTVGLSYTAGKQTARCTTSGPPSNWSAIIAAFR